MTHRGHGATGLLHGFQKKLLRNPFGYVTNPVIQSVPLAANLSTNPTT